MDEDQFTDELVADVYTTKKVLFQNIAEKSNSPSYLNKERTKMKKSFDYAFQYKLSTSLIVIGRSCDEAVMLIRSTLGLYQDKSFCISDTSGRFAKFKNYTARINGSLLLTDHEAIVDMANQFLVRNEKEANVNSALEDLEEHFKQCRQDGIPALIILEDFHVFAKRKRQTLIYTLLDFMHKKELLFMVSIRVHLVINILIETSLFILYFIVHC